MFLGFGILNYPIFASPNICMDINKLTNIGFIKILMNSIKVLVF